MEASRRRQLKKFATNSGRSWYREVEKTVEWGVRRRGREVSYGVWMGRHLGDLLCSYAAVPVQYLGSISGT